LSSSSVSGNLTSYTENYYDGSTVSVNIRDKGIFLADKQEIGTNLFSDPNYFSGNDVFDVRLPSRLFETWNIASGMGSDNITLQGGGGMLNVNAGGDNDRVTLLDLNHFVDGGSGIDLVSLQGARSSFQYDPISTTSFTLRDGSACSTLVNVERLKFSDISLALDVGPTQNAG